MIPFQFSHGFWIGLLRIFPHWHQYTTNCRRLSSRWIKGERVCQKKIQMQNLRMVLTPRTLSERWNAAAGQGRLTSKSRAERIAMEEVTPAPAAVAARVQIVAVQVLEQTKMGAQQHHLCVHLAQSLPSRHQGREAQLDFE